MAMPVVFRSVQLRAVLRSPSRLRGWAGVGVFPQFTAFELDRISPTRIASFDAMRPPPQAGEVKRVRG
jgi:hypothetical protein